MKVTKEVVAKILKKIEAGSHLYDELPKRGIALTQWYKSLQELNISTSAYTEHRKMVYTREKAEMVRARVKKGEFVSAVCAELGMEYMNFCRFCRRNGIKIMTKSLLKENYKRRAQNRTSVKGRKRTAELAAARKKTKKATPKKAVKKSAKKK